ncbi:choloylglycine hydrolase family protein [Oenococcus sp.]|uniref:choloylglycine hydrolase family protein n=1 Tax=Oenococcus sp. TaxID=1979414 RepID=UPI0039EB4764
MCTSITYQTEDNVRMLARTMDFSFQLGAKPIYIPRNYHFATLAGQSGFTSRLAFLGAGANVGGYIFADGLNEAGFLMAALYFSENAQYADQPDPDKANLESADLVAWGLGQASSVADFIDRFQKVVIVNQENRFLKIVVPLHWVLADKSGVSKVLEITATGVHYYDNQVGVMTNSPAYGWHMENLRRYNHLQPQDHVDRQYGSFKAIADGPGYGAMGLPGDYSSVSRFIRAVFLRNYIGKTTGCEAGAKAVFHLLNAFDIPKGVKIQANGESDYTQYKTVMDLTDSAYYFQLYDQFGPAKYVLDAHLLASDQVVELDKATA